MTTCSYKYMFAMNILFVYYSDERSNFILNFCSATVLQMLIILQKMKQITSEKSCKSIMTIT